MPARRLGGRLTASMGSAYESAKAKLKARPKREGASSVGPGAARPGPPIGGKTKATSTSDAPRKATAIEVVQAVEDENEEINEGRVTRALLRDATGCENLASATVAALHNADVAAIEPGDLDATPNLVSLDLSFNQLVDIDGAALAPLTNLCALILYNNRIASLKGVARLGQSLLTLQCQHNVLTSLAGVEHLRKLTSLNVSGNPLGDCKLVGRCTSLVRLDVSRCGLRKLEGFATLHALEELNAGGNALTEISSIAKCAKLQELDVSYNALTSTALKDLKALGRLDVLNLEGNALADLDSMPRMEELTELNVARNALRRLPDTFAGKCPELQILDLGECALEGDVGTVASALAGLAGLTELTLRFNRCAGGGGSGVTRAKRTEGVTGVTLAPAPPPSKPTRAAPSSLGRRIRTASDARPPAPPRVNKPPRPPRNEDEDDSDPADSGTTASDPWLGLDPTAAAAATLGYRREVIRVLPGCLYLDDTAVGDAERGDEEAARRREVEAKFGLKSVSVSDDGAIQVLDANGDDDDEDDVAAIVKKAPARPQSARRPKAADMSAKTANGGGDVAAVFIKEMEEYKSKMSGLIGKIRDGLKETRQEAGGATLCYLLYLDGDDARRETEAAKRALQRSKNGADGTRHIGRLSSGDAPSPSVITKRPASARAKLVEAQDAAKAALARFDSLFSEPFTLDDELTEETLDGTGAPETGNGGMLDGIHRGVGSTRGGRPRSARSSALVAAAVAAVDAEMDADESNERRIALETEGTRATVMVGTSKRGNPRGDAGRGGEMRVSDRRTLRPAGFANGTLGTGPLGKVLEKTRVSMTSRRPVSSGGSSSSSAGGGRGVPRATFRKPPERK